MQGCSRASQETGPTPEPSIEWTPCRPFLHRHRRREKSQKKRHLLRRRPAPGYRLLILYGQPAAGDRSRERKIMSPPLQIGEVLRDRYKITAYVGQGGMGSIYQAEDLRLEGRLCAIKQVENDNSLTTDSQQQARDQFYREASVL